MKTKPLYWIYYLLGWLCWHPTPVGAAEQGNSPAYQRQLFFGIALGELTMLDQGKSPFIYFGRALWGMHLGYERHTGQSAFGIAAGGSYGSFGAKYHPDRTIRLSDIDVDGQVSNSVIPLDAQMASARIDGYYLRNFKGLSSTRWTFQVGGSLMDEIYYPVDNFIAANPTNIANLDIQGRIGYRVAPCHQLSLDIHSALLAAITREPYDGTFSEPGKTLISSFFSKGTGLYSLPDYQKIELAVHYGFQPVGHLAYGIGGDWTFLHAARPQPYRTLNKRYHLSVGYLF